MFSTSLRAAFLFALLPVLGCAQNQTTYVVGPNALFEQSVGGLENTSGAAKMVAATNSMFAQALRVHIGTRAAETNSTQLTIPNATLVRKGDAILAHFWLRGATTSGKPGQIEFLFEKSTNPWTKSISQGASTAKNANVWKQHWIAFKSSETYSPGQAMVSLRFAFEPQTIEIGGLEVTNYGTSRTIDQLVELATSKRTLGTVDVRLDLKNTHQTMLGFGGDFCQPRYGSTEPMDVVGEYVLSHLKVVHARIGLPLEKWTPSQGVFNNDAQAKASLLCLQEMAKRKIPTVVSVWEGPTWMLPGNLGDGGRELPVSKYDACIDAIGKYLVTARDRYQAPVEYFSFNEADYGVNFKFSAPQIANFIRRAGPKWAALGLKTKFLVGDCGNGTNLAEYARVLLEDKSITAYLGPISLHCWDVLGANEETYRGIAKVAKQYGKPVWCLEAGHDAGLWQAENPWPTWENALRTAMAYERTLRLTGASLMDYWTYQDNYSLVDPKTVKPYPVFHVLHQMEQVFGAGTKVVQAQFEHDELQVLGTVNEKSGSFAVLLVNPAGGGTVHLSGLPAKAHYRVIQSDKLAQEQEIASGITAEDGIVKVALPARSVITILGRL